MGSLLNSLMLRVNGAWAEESATFSSNDEFETVPGSLAPQFRGEVHSSV